MLSTDSVAAIESMIAGNKRGVATVQLSYRPTGEELASMAATADATAAVFDDGNAGADAVTHSDPDHVGGLAGLTERFGLETSVPEGVAVDIDPRSGDGDVTGQFAAAHAPGHTEAHRALVDGAGGVAVLGTRRSTPT